MPLTSAGGGIARAGMRAETLESSALPCSPHARGIDRFRLQ